jgi:hypothetical protein
LLAAPITRHSYGTGFRVLNEATILAHGMVLKSSRGEFNSCNSCLRFAFKVFPFFFRRLCAIVNIPPRVGVASRTIRYDQSRQKISCSRNILFFSFFFGCTFCLDAKSTKKINPDIDREGQPFNTRMDIPLVVPFG